MIQRNLQLLALRPAIASIDPQLPVSVEEDFQNQTLRPVLKLQNDLLLAIFKDYLIEKKVVLQQMSQDKRLEYIQQVLQKDTALRQMIQGVIIGHFTEEEWRIFTMNKKALGKRLIGMAIQRLQSQVSLIA